MTAHPFRGHRWRLVSVQTGTKVVKGLAIDGNVTACLYRCDRPGCTEVTTEILDGRWTLQDLTKDLDQ